MGNLHLLLRRSCPAGLQVILAPFAVALADDTEVQPDLLVAPRAQFTDKQLPGAPLLAIEVLSPSTRRVDLLLKRDHLQAAGVPSHWLLDPDEPSVTVLELRDGVYVEVAHVTGDETYDAILPFPVRIKPSTFGRLARKRRTLPSALVRPPEQRRWGQRGSSRSSIWPNATCCLMVHPNPRCSAKSPLRSSCR